MPHISKMIFALMTFLVISGVSAVRAKADPIFVIFEFATLTEHPVSIGRPVRIVGNFSNPTSSTIFFTSRDVFVDDQFLGTRPYPTNPVRSLHPGEASNFLLGTFTFEPSDPPGLYQFDFFIWGGTTVGARDQIGALRIPVTVVAAVPEPATILMLGSGLAGIAAAVRKRRKYHTY